MVHDVRHPWIKLPDDELVLLPLWAGGIADLKGAHDPTRAAGVWLELSGQVVAPVADSMDHEPQ
jgi:hypothetical protein